MTRNSVQFRRDATTMLRSSVARRMFCARRHLVRNFKPPSPCNFPAVRSVTNTAQSIVQALPREFSLRPTAMDVVFRRQLPKLSARSFSDKAEKVAQPGDNVTVQYKGFLENGEIFIDGEDDPIEFKIGSGEVVVGLEKGVVGMHVGEKRVLTIPPEEGFGAHDPALVYDVPSSSLDEEFIRRVRPGSRIRLDEEPTEEGEERYGVVVDVRDDGVSIDTNEELVGKTLVVHVTLLDVEASSGST